MADDRLAEILGQGDVDAVRDYFRGLPEQRRRELFPQVAQRYRELTRERVIESTPGMFVSNPLYPAASVAYFATATGSELKRARQLRLNEEIEFEILADRRPSWCAEYVEWRLQDSFFWGAWRLIRNLVQAGLISRPEHPRYDLGIILGFGGSRTVDAMVEDLARSPDLLDVDIWKLFELEGEGECSLANADRWSENRKWSLALTTLAQGGLLSRERLLDASLDALARDFNHYRARWFCEFHDQLEPTAEEELARAERYLQILRASAPNVATWAFARVRRLANGGAYASEDLIAGLEWLLRAKAKGTVVDALKCLEEHVRRRPEDRAAVAEATLTALGHEKADAQRAALERLQAWVRSPADGVLERVAQQLDLLAAPVRKLAVAWLTDFSANSTETNSQRASAAAATTESASSLATSQSGQAAIASSRASSHALPESLRSLYSLEACLAPGEGLPLDLPAARFDGTELPRLAVVAPLRPIESVEELIDVAARVLEDGSLVDDFERCLAACARWADAKPAALERWAGPLIKRARQLLRRGAAPFLGLDPASELLGVVLAFCAGERVEVVPRDRRAEVRVADEPAREHWTNLNKPVGFLARRCQRIAEGILAGRSSVLWSEPTHAGGWIDPRALAARIAARIASPLDVLDEILALLRLAPEGRSAALASLAQLDCEWLAPVRYALGAPDVAPPTALVGDDLAIWIAAARARSPWGLDARVASSGGDVGPDAATPATYRMRFEPRDYGGKIHVHRVVEALPACSPGAAPELVTLTMHAAGRLDRSLLFEVGGFGGRTVGTCRWTATIWPLARESYFAGVANTCLENLDWWEAQWQNRALLEPLLDPGTPLRYVGLRLLVGMWGAQEPGEAGLAVDIGIQAIDDARLGTDNLSAGLTQFLGEGAGVVKLGRWQRSLAQIAKASSVHGALIQGALQAALGVCQPWPKDIGQLLELLSELSVELDLPIEHPGLRAALSNVRGGKSGKLAKQLLELRPTEARRAAAQSLLSEALDGRVRAARRFAASSPQ